jgi:hypothetical protein
MMSDAAPSPFRLNPAARLHIETIAGVGQIIVIDDFYADPDAVRALAMQGVYDSTLAYYPGVHAKIDKAELAPLFAQIAAIVNAVSGPICGPEAFVSDFSFVTTPARQMLAGQKHPHVDGLPLAGVAYLSPQLTVGTSFFRHIPTGLALVRNDEDDRRYSAWLLEHGEATQPATYDVTDHPTWEQLHMLEGRYNRMVMYPGNLFHAIAMVDVPAELTIDTARLTQRFFVTTLRPAS